MTLHEQALILYRKSTDDVRVLRLDLTGAVMTDEIWGFHAQQATEKLLKSIIACKERQFPFTHNLLQLVDLAMECSSDLPAQCESLAELTPFAAERRYSYIQPNFTSAKLDRERFVRELDIFRRYVANLLRITE